jgi:hypothetical protein
LVNQTSPDRAVSPAETGELAGISLESHSNVFGRAEIEIVAAVAFIADW